MIKFERILTSYDGRQPYISPEILTKTRYQGEPVHIWSYAFKENPEYESWSGGKYDRHLWINIHNMIINN
ncbi:unnamed protein product [Rotaria sordida]|uniref:Uncharacterized protein n=1 Tax=Rotaria sordida TaxID=392033 RepID=A0A815EDD7_9BILA|nr:unnamed protein product [Rotaria sordida]